MCIRDRIDKSKELPVLYESDARDCITFYLRNTLQIFPEDLPQDPDEEALGYPLQAGAVSYTHLDVYKRQSLNRAVTKDARILETLMNVNDYGRIDLQIGRRSLSEFYHKVLPTIKEIAQVQIQDAQTIEQYLYPEPEFSFFLDANEDVFTCMVKVQYRDQVFELTKSETSGAPQAQKMCIRDRSCAFAGGT